MSRTLMGQKDIPKYVKEALPRLYQSNGVPGEIVGYAWTLYGRYKTVYDNRLEREAERIAKWAQRYYAEANVIGESCFNKRIGARGYTHFIHINITDPVAKQIEIAIRKERSERCHSN